MAVDIGMVVAIANDQAYKLCGVATIDAINNLNSAIGDINEYIGNYDTVVANLPAEVSQARVSADNKVHATLTARLEYEKNELIEARLDHEYVEKTSLKARIKSDRDELFKMMYELGWIGLDERDSQLNATRESYDREMVLLNRRYDALNSNYNVITGYMAEIVKLQTRLAKLKAK